jgi:hypothetical protein
MKTRSLFIWLVLAAVLTFPAISEDPPAKPFRLVLKAYDGDPKRTNDYSKFSFQIDTVDLRQPSEFLHLGEMIPNTGLRLLKFVFKEGFDEKRKENVDISELVVMNPATGQTATLIYNKPVDVSGINRPPRQK